jgi:nitrite reductase/ring-hydroxylating ferredoxin subunit
MIHDVGPVDVFPEWRMRIVRLEGREIGVVRVRGAGYALRNVCPHQTGPLCQGMVVERVVSDAAGRLHLDPDHPVVTCPWHGWEFDLATGRCLADPSMRVATYPVELRDGRVYVVTDARRPARA